MGYPFEISISLDIISFSVTVKETSRVDNHPVWNLKQAEENYQPNRIFSGQYYNQKNPDNILNPMVVFIFVHYYSIKSWLSVLGFWPLT